MEPNVNIDFVTNGAVQGEFAANALIGNRLDWRALRPFIEDTVDINGKPCVNFGKPFIDRYKSGNPDLLSSYQAIPVANATLRRDEWKQLDEAVLAISDSRLGGIQDLIDKNLVFNLGNAMGTTVLEWHDSSDAMEAALTMDGITRSQGDRVVYSTNYLPLPIIHVDYEINARVLASSRSIGNALDVTNAERAARKVNEKLEAMLFTATSYAFGGGTIYSYLNEPNRNTVTLSENWNAAGKTAAEILADVIAMKQAAIDAKHFGTYMLYIPTAYETVLDEDYDTTTPGTTIRDRILKIANIDGVKVIDTLTANNVLLVQMSTDTVRLVRGMGIQNVEWQTEGKMMTKYKVMTIQVPQVRADQAGNSGVVHLSA